MADGKGSIGRHLELKGQNQLFQQKVAQDSQIVAYLLIEGHRGRQLHAVAVKGDDAQLVNDHHNFQALDQVQVAQVKVHQRLLFGLIFLLRERLN